MLPAGRLADAEVVLEADAGPFKGLEDTCEDRAVASVPMDGSPFVALTNVAQAGAPSTSAPTIMAAVTAC